MLRDILRLARAHSAPLEAVPAYIGGALALGSATHPMALVWAFFGVMYHFAGYSMNSYVDWKKGYDKNDENKQHHPLNRGMSPDFAKFVVFTSMLLALFIPLYWGMSNILAVGAVIVVGLVSGVSYNYYGKETALKPIPISVAHTTVFVIPYVAESGNVRSPLFLAGVVFVFLWVLFQIGVSGEIKDFKQDDEFNVLKHYGALDLPLIIGIPEYLRARVTLLKLVGLATGYYMLYYTGSGVLPVGIYTVFILVSAFFIEWLIEPGMYIRERRVSIMSKVEMLTAGMFCIAYSGVFGLPEMIAATGAAYCYTLAMNTYLWGSPMSVKV